MSGKTADGTPSRMGQRTKRIRRIIEIAASIAIIGLPLLVVALWLAFQHKPGWYRPPTMDPAATRQARRHAVALADYIGDRLIEGEPFEVVLDEREVNEWLAALPRLWPDAARRLPPAVARPAVHFAPDGVWLAAACENDGWRAVVSASLSVAVELESRALSVRLIEVRGGAIPLPARLVADAIDPLLQETAARSNDQTAPLSHVRSAQDLYEGIAIPNRFVWFNGRRPFEVAAVSPAEGKLRLRIVPR